MMPELDPATLAALGAGVAIAYLVFQRDRAWPWGRLYRATDALLATSVTRSAGIATSAHAGSTGSLSRAELGELEAFYLRWLNLPQEEREAARNELLRDQIDMIRLGDALRRYPP